MSSNDGPAEQTYAFGRRDTSGVVLGLTWAQLTCVATALAALTAGFVVGQGVGAGLSLLAVVPLLALAFAPVAGRTAVAWFAPVVNSGWQRATGQHRYLGGPAEEREELLLPGLGVPLPVYRTAAGGAIVENPSNRTAIVVLEVASSGFVLLDRGTQQRRVAAWGGLLASLCQSGHVARVQWLERTLPDSGDALQRWWSARGVKDCPAAHFYESLIRDAGPAAERHEAHLILSVDLRRLARQVRQAGGGRRGIVTVMEREMATFSSAAEAAEITVLGWASSRRLGEIVRTAYDPEAVAPLQRRQPGDQPAPGNPVATAGPAAHVTEWDRYRSDSGVHATYWISEWPRLPVHAGFLQPLLLECRARRTVSLVAQPLPTQRAARDIRHAKVEHLTNAAQRERIGQVTDQRHDAEYADVLQREAELVAGHGELRYTGFLTVTVLDEHDLPEACAALEQAALQSHLEIRRLYGQQDQAFRAAALPLALGLR